MFPLRFLPAPLPVVKSDRGPVLADSFVYGAAGSLTQQLLLRVLEPATRYCTLPFDWFCPTMKTASEWDRHVCSLCGLYCARKAALNAHRRVHHRSSGQTPPTPPPTYRMQLHENGEKDPVPEGDSSLAMPVYENIFDFLVANFA